jgi:signal transduction histidine kinase
MTHRGTVRLRLTVLYAALFLAAGATLLVINYALLSKNLPVHQVSKQTGQDVTLRARKMLDTESPFTLSAGERSTLTKIAAMSPQAAAEMVARHKTPGPIPRELLTSLPFDANRAALHQLLVQSLVALAIMAIVAAGLGWIVAGRVLRPIATMTATARRLSADRLDERIDLQGPQDELKDLADTFDDLLERLDRAFAGQRRFVANASHELRTPLTIIRTEADVALRRPDTTNADLRDTVARVRDAVDRLALASAEHGVEVVEHVDLADVARTTAGHLSAEAAAAQVEIVVDARPACVQGDPGLLDRLTQNLIENGIRHNRIGGSVRVATRTDADRARLEVTNTGRPIDPAQVPDLFEPFRRLGPDRTRRTGNGLGLSIVRSIVTAHAGELAAHAIAGGGLSVEIALPVAADHAGRGAKAGAPA